MPPSAPRSRRASVYVHFPWCLAKCPYCDFVSYAAPRDAIDHVGYADAVIRELALRARELELSSPDSPRRFGSVFFGGGTPSLWDPRELGRVLAAIRATVHCEPDVLTAPYGQTFDLEAVKAALKPEHRVVFLQATETSTAVRHDVEAIAKLVNQTDALLVVDGISGLGTTHFDVDGWGIDVLIGGSQKAVMIPPGLSYLSVSDKAWAAMETSKNPRYYFDLRKERKNAAKGESAYTPAVALIAGLGAALDYIAGQAGGDLEKGRIALVDNAQVNAAATRAGLVALGFTLFAPTAPAAAATAVAVPEGMNSGDVVKALKTRFALVTANGQGEMQGKIFRVAHLGFFDYLDTVALLGAMEHIAKDTLGLPVEYGQAVAAAQKVYADAVKK